MTPTKIFRKRFGFQERTQVRACGCRDVERRIDRNPTDMSVRAIRGWLNALARRAGRELPADVDQQIREQLDIFSKT